MVLKIKMIEINKYSTKPKIKCFKMPNAPYLERYMQLKKRTRLIN